MSTEKYVAGSGQGLTWGDAFTTAQLNGFANATTRLGDVAINNGTALDIYADLSIVSGGAMTASSNAAIFVGIYPLNKDGTTYGDGRFVSSFNGQFPSTYWVGNIPFVTASQTQTGTLEGIILPPGTFKFILFNASGANFAVSGNTCQYRTYNRSVT